jgi:hypothetical protein
MTAVRAAQLAAMDLVVPESEQANVVLVLGSPVIPLCAGWHA